MNVLETVFGSRRNARRLAAAGAFVCSLIAYLLTLEPDASYWDCPEYLVTALRLEVGHPPGNPVWALTARIFSFFGGTDPKAMAVAVNVSSALFTALAVGMLASIIFLLLVWIGFPAKNALKTSKPSKALKPLKTGQSAANMLRFVAAWGGAMCFGWADTPWFSAVEAEVYAMSLFLTALTVRLMIGWAMMPSGPRSRRMLLLIVYLTGLSVGVHQLNLLVIPALALIWLFCRRQSPAGVWRIILTLLIGCAAVGLILLLMMPGVLKAAAAFELFFVNDLHRAPHSGVIAFWATAMLICWLLPFCFRRPRLQLLAWIPAMLLTGYSSYMLLLMRGAANPPMNEGAPSNIFSLQSYLGRDQYGNTPLFYGRTPKSPRLRQEKINPDGTPDYSRYAMRDGAPHYALTDSGYVLYERARIPEYAPELNMFLPRLTSSDPDDISAYADWAGMTSSTMVPVEVSFALDSLGKPVGKLLPDGSRIKETELRPTYLQQMRYLFGYQIGYMYLRYLMWNYSGRQNDRYAVGEVEQGNFITGFTPLDNLMLGAQDKMPREIGKDNPGHNVYFMIPLILGIFGIVLLQQSGRRGRRANLVITVLFLMTGLAIVVYLNQSPREPRERDYSFMGSLWTYAFWIGLGMASLIKEALELRIGKRKYALLRKGAIAGAIILSIGMPIWMLAQNFDDHDRSGRHGVSDFATNFLRSLEPDAILITNGDNYTFPLWWAQEVLGIRRDVTIINAAYLGTPWYIAQLRGDSRGEKGLKMLMPADDLLLGGFRLNYYDSSVESPSRADSLAAVDAITALKGFYNAPAESRRLPKMLRIYNPEGGDSLLVRSSAIASASSSIGLRQLAILDIIANNAVAEKPRPVYWQSALSASDYAGMRPFTTRALQSRRFVYSDSLTPEMERRLLDLDYLKALNTLSGRKVKPAADGKNRVLDPRLPYADDVYGQMITNQRQNLLRLGGRLLKNGRPQQALRIAHLVDSLFPAEYHEYRIFTEADSAIDEGSDLARLYLEGARQSTTASTLRGNADYRRGLDLLQRERARYAEWRDYRNALPPHLREVMSPKNYRKTLRVERLDSLIRKYDLFSRSENK